MTDYNSDVADIVIALFMLAAVAASALIIRLLPLAVPTPVVQILLGASLAAVTDFQVRLEPDLFFLLFLPPLLFLDGWRIPKQGLLRDKGTILELALGLVVATVVGMGFFIHWLIPAVPLPIAFALAAIVSPTDPVALSAITERVHVPERVMHVLEAESLLNDASGLVCFRFAVAAAVTGTFSLWMATLTFVQLASIGVITGIVLTLAVSYGKNWISHRYGEEPGSQVIISLLIPFAAYAAAEHFGGSGILAAVAAGITMSYMELSGRALASTRMQRAAVWDTLQFALNGTVFVLLGEQLPDIFSDAVEAARESHHVNPWWLAVYVLAITLGLALLRFVWVWTSLRFSSFLARQRGEKQQIRVPVRLIAAMSAAGVRGAITLAGVLTLPFAVADGTPLPARELAIFLAAGVIILSLTAASIVLPPLLAGLMLPGETAAELEAQRARIAAAEAALRAVEAELRTLASGRNDADVYAEASTRVLELYQRRIAGHATSDEAVRIRLSDAIERQLRLTGLRAERDALFALARVHALSDSSCRELVREVDLQEERFR